MSSSVRRATAHAREPPPNVLATSSQSCMRPYARRCQSGLVEYPGEKDYRHSLKEEAAALRIVAEIASKDLKDGKVKSLDESLNNLIKLNDAGLLEAYILFARPDQGIARDYDTYRKANREKLRRYWLEIVIGRS